VREGFLTTRDWEQFNSVNHSVIRTESLTPEELVRAEQYVMKQVYHSPTYLLRRFRFAANLKECATLARKGIRLFTGRY
jgi:hypothetical protein